MLTATLLLTAHLASAGEPSAISPAVPAIPAPTIALRSSVKTSMTGAFQLTWHLDRGADTGTTFRLERTAFRGAAPAKRLYEGTDTARFESGLSNGDYRFMVSAIDARGRVIAASKPIDVKVFHHPLTRAWRFFALGAAVFGATTGWVFGVGARTGPVSS